MELGLTERAAHRIVHELEDAGYLRIVKRGRRNSYIVNVQEKVPHPIEGQVSIADLLAAISD